MIFIKLIVRRFFWPFLLIFSSFIFADENSIEQSKQNEVKQMQNDEITTNDPIDETFRSIEIYSKEQMPEELFDDRMPEPSTLNESSSENKVESQNDDPLSSSAIDFFVDENRDEFKVNKETDDSETQIENQPVISIETIAPKSINDLLNIEIDEAKNRLVLLIDGNIYKDEQILSLPASISFKDYQFKSLFKPQDFKTNSIIYLTDLKANWEYENQEKPVNMNDSLCDLKETETVLLKITGKLYEFPFEKTYKFKPKIGICYLKPKSLQVQDKKYSNDFILDKGFKSNSAIHFPTTAFRNAEFDVVLNQKFPEEYRLRSSHQDSGVNVSGYFAETDVKFMFPPKGKVTIELLDEYENVVDSYSFQLKRWFVNSLSGTFPFWNEKKQISEAIDYCVNYEQKEKGRYILALPEFVTNAPYDEKSKELKKYSRAIGEGLLPEWGNLSAYLQAGWTNFYYWTGIKPGEKKLFTIELSTGRIISQSYFGVNYVVCSLNLN